MNELKNDLLLVLIAFTMGAIVGFEYSKIIIRKSDNEKLRNCYEVLIGGKK